MTRKELWRKIGDAFATPVGERTKTSLYFTDEGVCGAMALFMDPLMEGDDPRWGAIQREISMLHRGRLNDGLWLPDRWGFVQGWTPYCDEVRAMFCYLMAELSDKEYNELLEAK